MKQIPRNLNAIIVIIIIIMAMQYIVECESTVNMQLSSYLLESDV